MAPVKLDPHIYDILELARLAPSADNTQPWNVVVPIQGEIDVYYNEQDGNTKEDYSWQACADYLSLGMFIESIVFAARSKGYTPRVELCLKGTLVAKVFLGSRDAIREEYEIERLLRHRHTDRRPYAKTPVSDALLNRLKQITTEAGWSLDVSAERKKIRGFRTIMALHDRLFWSIDTMRSNMTNKFRYGPAEIITEGFPLSTLGLGVERFFLRQTLGLAKRVPFLWYFIAWRAGQREYRTVNRSGGIGLLSFPGLPLDPSISPTVFHRKLLEGGQVFQRLWLECTREKVAFQPCFGPVVILYRLLRHEPPYTPRLEAMYQDLLKMLKNQYPQGFAHFPVMFFRMGYARERAAPRTPRKPVLALLRT